MLASHKIYKLSKLITTVIKPMVQALYEKQCNRDLVLWVPSVETLDNKA